MSKGSKIQKKVQVKGVKSTWKVGRDWWGSCEHCRATMPIEEFEDSDRHNANCRVYSHVAKGTGTRIGLPPLMVNTTVNGRHIGAFASGEVFAASARASDPTTSSKTPLETRDSKGVPPRFSRPVPHRGLRRS